jgi:hypothetical protein
MEKIAEVIPGGHANLAGPQKQAAELCSQGEPGPLQVFLQTVEDPSVVDKSVGLGLMFNAKKPAPQHVSGCVLGYGRFREQNTHLPIQ